MSEQKTFLTKGKLERSTDHSQVEYEFPGAKDFFSIPANLIPAIGGVSGGRVLLGSKATLQAVSLTKREAPLVQATSSHQEETINNRLGRNFLSLSAAEDGKVTEVTGDHIKIKGSAGEKTYEIYDNYNLGRKTFLHHEARVKVGDTVKKGDLIATTNYTDNKGNLALGTNLKTAVMPYRSGNFEDAWVVTESGAKKMEAEQIMRVHLEQKMGIETGKSKYVSLFPNKYSNSQLSTIDSDGVVKKGTILKMGDPTILAVSPKALKSTDVALGKLSKVLANAYKDNSEVWDYEHVGEVVDVVKAGGQISINIKTKRSLQVGDKLCMTPDHEVLTKDGWKLITDVAVYDEVYTLRTDGTVELLRPISLPTYWYEGKMYSLETTQVSMFVTPNHKLFAQRRFNNEYTGNYTLQEAKELYGKRFKLKTSGNWKGQSPTTVQVGSISVPTLVYVTVLGLFLGDGNTFWQPERGTYGFDIAQKKPAERRKIKQLLEACGFTPHAGDKAFRVHSKDWAIHLKRLGHAHEKYIPREVFSFGPQELQRLYECLMLTDGSEKGSGHSYITVSPRLANDFHQLLFLIGKAGTLSLAKGPDVYEWTNGRLSCCRQAYRISIYNHKTEPEVNHGHSKKQTGQKEEWVDYVGQVYCLTFEQNHVFYIRHNGKAHWTGNSNAWGAKGVCGCYDDKTEVFTDKGWISWVDAIPTTRFACLSAERVGFFSEAQKVVSYDYTGPLLGFRNKQLDYLVTPNHRMYCRVENYRGVTAQYKIRTAEDTHGKALVHLAAAEFCPTGDKKEIDLKNYVDFTPSKWHKNRFITKFDLVAFAGFLGWYISEGSTAYYEGIVGKTKSHVRSYKIQISQRKEQNFLEIERVLTSLGVKWWYLKASGQYTFSNQYMYHYLARFGLCYDKFLPKEVFDWPKEAQLALLLGLVGGDGHKIDPQKKLVDGHEYAFSYTSSSYQLCKDVEHLCTLLGYNAIIRKKIDNEGNRWDVKVKANKESGQSTGEFYITDYTGKVYCAEVPGGLLYVRRGEGRPFWCGNSIIPDAQAPTDKNGVPMDILLNSMSITSRVAPALAITLGMGKFAEKLGRPVKMKHFTDGSSIHKAIDKLKKEGIADVEEVYDPITGQNTKVLTGPLYFTRLIHIAEDKESSRSQGAGYNWENQPAKTETESAKRVGNLATAALLSHGASAVLRDLGTVKSTKNDEYWRKLKLGQQVQSPGVPFIFNKFLATMQGAGIKVDKKGDIFNILPITDKDVGELSHGEIKNAGTFKIKGEKAIAEAGGLFDPIIVGLNGEKFNHIDLNFSIPNPISEDYLRKLLGVTKAEYERLIVSGEITQKLGSINVDAKIQEYLKYLKSGRKTERENALKLVAFLRALKNGGKQPKDLLLSKIPVLPAQYRPMMVQSDMVLSSPVNTLYKELIQNNDSLKDVTGVPDHVIEKLKKDQYAAVKAVYGLGDPITIKSKEKAVKGLLATTIGSRGGSGKTTLFQAKVVNKPLDLVGRAVLTPDAKLDLDEASVPQDIIWKTYAPFVTRRLVMSGVPATFAAEYVEKRNPLAISALNTELKTRPGIVSRDPSLHKFNLTGFYLKPNADPKDKTIKLNPLVFKSFNADNDGDQLNVNIPVSEDARQEVIDKMLPSKNLLSPKTLNPMYTPSNEAALGLFQASTEDHNNAPKKFETEAAVIQAFNRGELDVGDRVEITGK